MGHAQHASVLGGDDGRARGASIEEGQLAHHLAPVKLVEELAVDLHRERPVEHDMDRVHGLIPRHERGPSREKTALPGLDQEGHVVVVELGEDEEDSLHVGRPDLRREKESSPLCPAFVRSGEEEGIGKIR